MAGHPVFIEDNNKPFKPRGGKRRPVRSTAIHPSSDRSADRTKLGNNRLDTFEIYSFIPRSGYFSLFQGMAYVAGERQGRNCSRHDASRSARHKRQGPDLVLVVTVEKAFLHNPKCEVRSRLWKPEEWPDRRNVPTLAEPMSPAGRYLNRFPEFRWSLITMALTACVDEVRPARSRRRL
jgi:hypothetical protein